MSVEKIRKGEVKKGENVQGKERKRSVLGERKIEYGELYGMPGGNKSEKSAWENVRVWAYSGGGGGYGFWSKIKTKGLPGNFIKKQHKERGGMMRVL
jgi:hypothetical protein